jgi:hypothetical protein
MAWDWATQKERYAGKLKVQSLGRVGNNAPASQAITTNHTTITYVDCGTRGFAVTESVLGPNCTVSQAPSGAENTYGLPWETGYAARTSLAGAQTRFVTPCLNGCGVFISGTRAAPVVVHANCQATALLSGFTNQLGTYFRLWSDVYVTVASQLVAKRLIPDAGLAMFLPTDYMVEGVSEATVFGVCEASNWSFYATLNRAAAGQTRRIWPA